MPEQYLLHSKGAWKKHKYIKKIGNRYYYSKNEYDGSDPYSEANQAKYDEKAMKAQRLSNRVLAVSRGYASEANNIKKEAAKIPEVKPGDYSDEAMLNQTAKTKLLKQAQRKENMSKALLTLYEIYQKKADNAKSFADAYRKVKTSSISESHVGKGKAKAESILKRQIKYKSNGKEIKKRGSGLGTGKVGVK